VTDARLVLRATGLLRQFNELGVLRPADVHVAQRLGSLGGEDDERVLLAAALAVRGVRQGSVVLRLADVPALVTPDDAEDEPVASAAVELPWPGLDGWRDAVERSPLVASSDSDGVRPLRWDRGGIWLDKYWRQEVAVAEHLLARAVRPVDVDELRLRETLSRLWPSGSADDQRFAAAVAVLAPFAVIAGGPGTGKTTTVAKMLAALRASSVRPPRVALAAPTGKAAARLQESVLAAAAEDDALLDDERAYLRAQTASTLHRLLGVRRGSARYWHHAGNPLPHDIVVVDEASMLSLTMFARLLDALRPAARLVLVGDPDQLASVEAGAVLADLVAPALDGVRTDGFADRLGRVGAAAPSGRSASDPAQGRVGDGVAVLRTVRRYDAGGVIASLAEAIRRGSGDEVLDVLHGGGSCGSTTWRTTRRCRRTCSRRFVPRWSMPTGTSWPARRPATRRGRFGAGPASAAVRAPARPARCHALGAPGAALAGRGPRCRPATRRPVRRAAAAGHRERLRQRPLQR
jgi:exodeoxyribonuclease V alpha subunit